MLRWHEVGAEISRQRRASAVDENGGGGKEGNKRSGRKPDQGNAERGVNRRSIRETAVDERRREGR